MRIKHDKPKLSEVDMTPMIDIVFQLIAFFMVITNFDQTQADERVKLPKDQLAKPPEVKREDKLVLNVGFIRDQSGEKVDDQPYVFYSGEQVPVLEFGPKLEQEKRIFKSTKVDPKSVTVVIRADSEVPTGLVQELIRLSQKSDYEKFALKATQKTTTR